MFDLAYSVFLHVRTVAGPSLGRADKHRHGGTGGTSADAVRRNSNDYLSLANHSAWDFVDSDAASNRRGFRRRRSKRASRRGHPYGTDPAGSSL